MLELVRLVAPDGLNHLDWHALVDEHAHAVSFYAAAATSCAKSRASDTDPVRTLG
jgi:hypothetical protein